MGKIFIFLRSPSDFSQPGYNFSLPKTTLAPIDVVFEMVFAEIAGKAMGDRCITDTCSCEGILGSWELL